jgi:hypothetical protein
VICQPLRVLDLVDESHSKQLIDLFTDEVFLLHGLPPRFLLHRSCVGTDLQCVFNHLPRDPEHLRWFPGKYIDISSEENQECELLFITKAL